MMGFKIKIIGMEKKKERLVKKRWHGKSTLKRGDERELGSVRKGDRQKVA
jgi:hypothetical protein